MDVITLPPTPRKFPSEGVSSQILPLSRLSSGGSPNDEECKSSSTPVRVRLNRLTRSLADSLLQYFQDVQESEEPDVLSTPRSVNKAVEENTSKHPRKLLFTENSGQQYQNIPPVIVSDL